MSSTPPEMVGPEAIKILRGRTPPSRAAARPPIETGEASDLDDDFVAFASNYHRTSGSDTTEATEVSETPTESAQEPAPEPEPEPEEEKQRRLTLELRAILAVPDTLSADELKKRRKQSRNLSELLRNDLVARSGIGADTAKAYISDWAGPNREPVSRKKIPPKHLNNVEAWISQYQNAENRCVDEGVGPTEAPNIMKCPVCGPTLS